VESPGGSIALSVKRVKHERYNLSGCTVRLSSSDRVLPLAAYYLFLFSNFTTPTLLSTTAIAEHGFGVILSPSFLTNEPETDR
jgi:hypothetical protein